MNRIICIIIFLLYISPNIVKGQAQEVKSDRHIDPIGLTTHVRYLRGFGDSAIVSTRHGGWTIDSVRVFEKHYEKYLKPCPYIMHYLSKRDKKRIMKGLPFMDTYRWLTINSKNRKLTFSAEMSYELRYATVYLHKGGYVDSVRLNQPAADPFIPRLEFDLYPKYWTFPASGGSIEATTRGKGYTIKNIIIEKYVNDGWEADKDGKIVKQANKVTREWITVETYSNVVKVTVEPNDTEKPRSFKIEFMSDKTIERNEPFPDFFLGDQESLSETK